MKKLEKLSKKFPMDEIEIEVVETTQKKTRKTPSRKTSPYMTKFEYTKLLGVRALQLDRGEPPKVDRNGRIDNFEIAREEINKRVVPLAIKRTLPGGKYEIWKITELNIRSW